MVAFVLRALLTLAAALGGRRSAFAAVAVLVACGPAMALVKGRLTANVADGYGRITLTFDDLMHAKLRSSNGVLIVDFENPVALDVSKLPTLLSAYVSIARIDPDGRAIRLGLRGAFRPNLLEAGEKVFLDLLPPTWSGLPPGLPQDVVDALAERARLAEERLRAMQPRDVSPPTPLPVRVIKAPTYTRLIFPVKASVPVDFSRIDETATLNLKGRFDFDPRILKPDLPDGAKEISAEADDGMLKIAITANKAIGIKGFREEDTYIVDISAPSSDKPKGKTAPKIADAPPAPAADAHAAEPKPAEPKAAESKPAEMKAAEAKPAEPGQQAHAAPPASAPAPVPPPAAEPAVPAGQLKPVAPQFERVGDSLRITLPFNTPVPAAAFQRAGAVWLVFDNKQPVASVPLPDVAGFMADSLTVQQIGGANVLRLQLKRPSIINLAQQGKGWIATIGEQGLASSAAIVFGQAVNPEGRTIIRAPLPGAGAVHWLTDPDAGDKLAVITALGPPRGLPKAQSFVEIKALPSAHGLALSPTADDMIITAGLDDVTIGRGRELTLSPAVKAAASDGKDQKALIADANTWREDASDNIRATERKLEREAADVPKRQRTDARLRLARFYLANGFYPEAIIVLQAIAQEDETASANKAVQMTTLMADVLAKRLGDARKILNQPSIANDPESQLWNAVADAYQTRWPQALAGFRATQDVIDRYPDALQAIIRPLVIDAALNSGEPLLANSQVQQYEALNPARVDTGLAALLRGRIAEAQGNSREALGYLQAAIGGNRMVEAAARLQKVQLQLKNGEIERGPAIAELETIGAIWRRDEIEIKALAQLAKLYTEENRWRDAFSATRRATETMPDHPLTRGLQDDMSKTFLSMFLDGNDHGLSKVEALGLYYDFKQFTPPGRDGDLMIRRLADRLAELDLLDQATELLRYQVERRLDGVARAQVAARLAVMYLQNHKPADAVETLRSTRMSELPGDLRRARTLLEARGLSDMSLTDLAVELLAPLTGEDASRLRADILWRGKRWRDAGEAFELMLGDLWRGDAPLADLARADVLRAGVSYVLGDDQIGLDRLRSKYAAKMADSADARVFGLISGDIAKNMDAFRDIARTVVSVDTFKDFLDSYRKKYPEIAGAPQIKQPEPPPQAPSQPLPKAADGHAEKKPEAKPAAKADHAPEHDAKANNGHKAG